MINFKAIRLHICVLWQFFCKHGKNKENEQCFEGSPLGMAGMIYLHQIWYVVSSDMPANLVLFGKEITELRTGIKSYLALCVNTLTLCACPNSWAAQHTIMCLATIIACNILYAGLINATTQ